MLQFSLGPVAEGQTDITINQLVIAGWAGRDSQAVLAHIRELEALGVPAPGAVPLFYRASATLLTQQNHIEVLGEQSSGEAEPFLFRWQGESWLTLSSDHTDRQLETHSVALAKQVCAKPLARDAWRLSEVADDWDNLLLQSWVKEGADWTLYQQGYLAELRTPDDLLTRYAGGRELPEGLGMSCGTLSALGGIRPARQFRMALVDEKRGRSIEHQYQIQTLPLVA
ncbi:DUF2848 domain-containing protein [Erwinia persicina]|uniref:DUF2848 domain-containing protein n=1 Tax=Erwinia persicina TaxID=55211 RepID=UPI00177C1C75|nr:DUF2848 domain-containing protein [Erwinia persicina]MBD8164115.1 DUF2848 domain-containing protein [Erwinia persicina]MBD8215712.1 DUF2848 domain-containing protein [Erwinia persicina]